MLNRAIMMGRLCADPELKHTQTQVAVRFFCIAVDRDYSILNLLYFKLMLKNSASFSKGIRSVRS